MKVAVFLDYANVNASSQNLNCQMDYAALLDYLIESGNDDTDADEELLNEPPEENAESID